MPRPTNKEYRALILGAFDTHMHRTLKEVIEHLKANDSFISEQSTRRMLNRMTGEGLLIELGRGEKNAVIWTKALFSPFKTFKSLDGNVVDLKTFISHVSAIESSIIDDKALTMLKAMMLDALGSTLIEAYEQRSPVAEAEVIKRELSTLATALVKWYTFIREFVDSKIWDDFNRAQLAKEFKTRCAEEHAVIVDELWK